ncbi:hypothetical protein [Pseudomonas cremoricolorata]|uniref:hypothetical protein n=1 Tax=Pseudomonas cremoricolorata TaxID=157783 RepID=UPI001FE1DDD8|nr:hypothetical protein [Pseudomonas cremoricolorata]
MSKASSNHATSTLALAPAISGDALPDIPGGSVNLLPVTALSQPLRLNVLPWLNSRPTPDTPERLTLYWNDQPVGEKSWDDTIRPADLYIDVPVSYLVDGQATVTYEVQIYNGVVTPSQPLLLTVDRIAPTLGGDEGQLQFDTHEVTERYLEQHDDILLGAVPAYAQASAGDTLIYYWDARPFANQKAGERELTIRDIGKPLFIAFEGELIREREDGERYVHYQIRDRAGNLSPRSRPAVLSVAALPAPRILPGLDVAQAAGAGDRLTLNLDDFSPPLLVQVPACVVIYPEETLTVEWGMPGSADYYCTRTEHPNGERQYEIPLDKVLAQSKRTIRLDYTLVEDGRTSVSTPIELTVKALSRGLPQPNLTGASATGFSLATAPANVPITLGTWPFIQVGQRVSISVTGVLANGAEAPPYHVLVAHAVTELQAEQGIGLGNEATVSKAFLAGLKRLERFTTVAQVSFDDGATWVRFPVLNLTLRD